MHSPHRVPESSPALFQERLLTGKFEATTETTDAEHAILEVVRLTGEEVEFRPVALVGEMAETSASLVAAAVGVSQSGPYNAFIMPAESAGQQFVVRSCFPNAPLQFRSLAPCQRAGRKVILAVT